MGPTGHVKFFRSSNIGTSIKQVRHGNHEKVHVYGVWWCDCSQAAEVLKKRLDSLLQDTFSASEGAGFYHMAVPKDMAQKAVELAAGETGVVIFTKEQREEWLFLQTKERARKVPRGF